MDRSSKQKINKEIESIDDILAQMDLIDILKHVTPEQQNAHFLKCTWNIF